MSEQKEDPLKLPKQPASDPADIGLDTGGTTNENVDLPPLARVERPIGNPKAPPPKPPSLN